MFALTNGLLSQLTGKAGISGRSRQTFNIHASYDEPCQRFLNAINIGSYIQPHRHSLDDRKEMLVACKGKFAIIEFFNNGDFKCFTLFGTEKYFDKGVSCFGVEVPPDCWHTVIALEPMSVLLEVKEGPFETEACKECASWAPSPESPNVEDYVDKLYDFCSPHFEPLS
tara:strand:- start:2420 stop:2926 length:507 start_codon:yes stop_codon:yes gene_type:complete